MGRPRSFCEEQVLEEAVRVFRERGFGGASVPELVKRLGICRQSLYQAFGDKRGLFLKALERWGQREVEAKLRLLRADGPPLDALRTIICGFADLAARCPTAGCLTARAIAETDADPEAQAILQGQVARLEAGYLEALEAAQARGELRPEARPDQLAAGIITSTYGIGLLARLPDSGPRIGRAVAELLARLDEAAA